MMKWQHQRVVQYGRSLLHVLGHHIVIKIEELCIWWRTMHCA